MEGRQTDAAAAQSRSASLPVPGRLPNDPRAPVACLAIKRGKKRERRKRELHYRHFFAPINVRE